MFVNKWMFYGECIVGVVCVVFMRVCCFWCVCVESMCVFEEHYKGL